MVSLDIIAAEDFHFISHSREMGHSFISINKVLHTRFDSIELRNVLHHYNNKINLHNCIRSSKCRHICRPIFVKFKLPTQQEAVYLLHLKMAFNFTI